MSSSAVLRLRQAGCTTKSFTRYEDRSSWLRSSISSMATQRKGGKSNGTSGRSALSVVVPAYNETDNIRPLCERLFKALNASSIDGELLIMDDESVGTAPTKAVVAKLKFYAKKSIVVKIK